MTYQAKKGHIAATGSTDSPGGSAKSADKKGHISETGTAGRHQPAISNSSESRWARRKETLEYYRKKKDEKNVIEPNSKQRFTKQNNEKEA